MALKNTLIYQKTHQIQCIFTALLNWLRACVLEEKKPPKHLPNIGSLMFHSLPQYQHLK